MTKEKAIELLQKQIDSVEQVKQQERFSQEFKKWRRDSEIIIEKIFGNQTRHLNDFKDISYRRLQRVGFDATAYEKEIADQKGFIGGMNTAKTILTSMRDELVEFSNIDNKGEVVEDNPLAKIEKICNRFHLVARQIRARHDNRQTIDIEDEYDVQDLLHAILKLEFDDIRPEECTPSYAGKSSRMDFLLKKENIIIEVKKTRKGLTEKEVGDQLLVDIQRYQQYPDCKCLVCFVYDPDGRISNPRGLENDLSKTVEDLRVITIIRPEL